MCECGQCEICLCHKPEPVWKRVIGYEFINGVKVFHVYLFCVMNGKLFELNIN